MFSSTQKKKDSFKHKNRRECSDGGGNEWLEKHTREIFLKVESTKVLGPDFTY